MSVLLLLLFFRVTAFTSKYTRMRWRQRKSALRIS